MTLDRAFKIANDNGYKQSTVERMLRPSNSPYVITTKNKKGYNTGYIYTVETTFKPYATNSKEPTGKTSKG